MATNTLRNSFSLKAEWLALLFLVLCSFVTPISVTATTITFLLAWILILVSGNWASRWQYICKNKVAISFWLLFCLFLFGLIYTVSPAHLAFKDLQKRHWLLITPFFMMLLTDDRWRNRMINAFLISMLATVILSYLKYLGIDLIKLIAHIERSNTNVFFEHIVQNFFMSVAAFIFGYRFFYQIKWRWLNGIIFLLMLFNIVFLSAGRTGYLQFGLLLFFLSVIRFQFKGIFIALIACLLIFSMSFFFSPRFNARVTSIVHDTQQYQQGQTKTSTGLRIAMWQDAAILIKKHPWLGVGTGGIKTAMNQSLSPDIIKKTGLINYVENSLLNFVLEFGVVGLIVYLGFLATQIFMSFKLPAEYKHLMQAFLIAYLAGSLLNSFFVSFCETHLFALFTAVCFSAYTPNKKIILQGELSYETA